MYHKADPVNHVEQLRNDRVYLTGAEVAQHEINLTQAVLQIVATFPIGRPQTFVGMDIIELERSRRILRRGQTSWQQ